ncbi:lysostaphin resistance A-like protein [Halobaculum sp. MBLA0147]|uniref:CPBP family intramembrane glutamic endopeptidase n=1 Tax=Halobaculum sp. MBLA0147 TaxID=3079934 RepID=UPI0035259559
MTTRHVSIDGRVTGVVGFLLVLVVYFAVNHWVDTAVPAEPELVRNAVEAVWFLGFAAIGAVFLYRDDASPSDIGLAKRFLLPGAIAFLAVWVGLNVVGVGIATASGNAWGLDVLWPVALGGLVASFGYAFVEEFVVRGYLQNKVRSVLGANGWVSRGTAIVVAGALFGLAHVPRVLVEGGYVSGTSVVGTLLVLTLSGVGFGLVYELTENLYFVGLLHGLGNTWPLLVDGFTWDGTAKTAFFVAIGVTYFGIVGVYRRVTARTSVTPRVRVTPGGATTDRRATDSSR